ncbi:MAG: 6-phosphofructokinase [Elusimicrobia bacterium RIFOXYA12_FULL_51_18]|nr:MAG: 6-phosphofructokinase [Elusimicrobia bacterium RIFOXYA12_FULL_51_18]OGS31565.1 MAG: 6-phosphofructokinase [Elusimicrobia bacterium RIFOXYA2_FULL_53_38]
MKIGILTGGGDCPGLNAVVRGVTKAALRKGWEVIGFKDGYKGVVENRFENLDDRAVSGILIRGGTILGTSNTANPFAYTLEPFGSAGSPKDLSGLAVKNLKKAGVNALVAIGGDGTLNIAYKLHKNGFPVVGVPKTIDNDLSATDVTFGFDSALKVATEAIDNVHTTAESHHRVMIVETMGRYAGWIALRSGIAGGGDIILLPEIPYRPQDILKAVNDRRRRGKHFSIVVVSEGAKPENGEMTVNRVVAGSTDPLRLGGVSYKIAGLIEKNIEVECRVVVLGHLQRGGSPTPFDRWLATGFGVGAVDLIERKKFGRMMSLSCYKCVSVTLAQAVGKLRRVPLDCPEIRTALSVGTSFGNAKITA